MRKISTNLFLGYESKNKKSTRTLFRKPLEKKVTEGDITLATSASQKEEVPRQANFIDENLNINMKQLMNQWKLFMNQ